MFPFVGSSSNGRSPNFDAARLVNMYVEKTESGASRSAAMLVGTPGLNPWLTLSGGGIKGCIRFSATVSIVIAGTTVWKVTSAKVATNLGTITAPGATVSMASNGTVIMLVAGATGYFINPTLNTVTMITSANFLGSTNVDFNDGYFVFNKMGTGQFQISQLYGTTIAALDFATAEGAPDNIVSLIVDHRELWLLGENTTEIWYDIGNVDFPFQRVQGAFLEIGCAASASVAKMDNSIFWLATDDRGYGTVQRAVGYSPQRISNHVVEAAIATYSVISDAVGYTYSQAGHSFYVISFPTADASWCYDAATNEWHERRYTNSDGTLGRHRSNCQMNFAGLTIVGDWATANLYSLDLNYYTDNGAAIKRIRICPHITQETRLQFFHSLELTMQTGVGLPSGQGSNPQAMLRWSDDGGRVWSSEIWATIGAQGNYKTRVKWRRMGKSRDRLFEVSITDPIQVIITDASLSVTAGAS